MTIENTQENLQTQMNKDLVRVSDWIIYFS